MPATVLADGHVGERQRRILDAAERCFIRTGFHRCTMQDVAAEAGMSPGNLYRYFPSKDAIVIGLAERDRAEMSSDFRELAETTTFLEAFGMAMRKHMIDEPAGNAVLCMEIWSESARNDVFRQIHLAFETEVHTWIVHLAESAKTNGEMRPDIDTDAFAVLLVTLANGLFVRRALASDFDAEREIEVAIAIAAAAMNGVVPLPPARRVPAAGRTVSVSSEV